MRLASLLIVCCALATPALAANPHIHRGPTSPRLFRSRTMGRPALHPSGLGESRHGEEPMRARTAAADSAETLTDEQVRETSLPANR